MYCMILFKNNKNKYTNLYWNGMWQLDNSARMLMKPINYKRD
jgi:hypothetical protein